MKKILLMAVAAAYSLNMMAQTTAKEWYEKGMTLKKEKKYNDALNAFKKAISLNANYGEAYFQLGWCHNELGQYAEALDAYRKEEKLNPADPAHSYFEMGFAYKSMNNDQEAVVFYSKAIQIDPDYSAAYKHRGYCYYRLKDFEKALEDFNKHEDLEWAEIEDPDFWYDKGWVENDLGKYQDAINSLKRAILLDKNFGEAYSELGYSNYKLRQNDEALTNYRLALALNPKDHLSLIGMADVFFDNIDNHDSAMFYYEKAVQVNQKIKSVYYRLGWCYNEKEKYREAVDALKKAIELDKDYYIAMTELGYSYYKLNQCTDALSYLEKVKAAWPKHELSRYYAGFCYHLKNDQASLRKMIDELRTINTDQGKKYAETLMKYVK